VIEMSSASVAVRTDAKLQEEVIEELKWDSRVDATAVGVTVKEGVVMLTGNVESYATKMAARDAAHRVPGVLDVADNIQVKIPGKLAKTDVELAHAVRRALEWDVMVPDKRIESTVANGWITLSGTVDLLREREDAERAVKRLAGVCGVINNIVVIGPKLEAEDVRQMIEQALDRRAEKEAERIKVEVADGSVKLSGRVWSWAEKRAIIGAVSHAPGVISVDDKLFVDPLF